MPLFDTRKFERFEENIGALSIQLTQQDLAEIDNAKITIQGARYPEAIMKLSGR